MRYLALVALLAFLAVPFLAGCSGKTEAPKPVEKAKEKPVEGAKPVEPAAPAAPATPAAPDAPAAPAPK